ncbi:MAG: hypothetical protein R2780_09510 [Crocinitomicaceae bacterium]|nr:hypothetical protein [Crocinitomicaceae bacterium]
MKAFFLFTGLLTLNLCQGQLALLHFSIVETDSLHIYPSKYLLDTPITKNGKSGLFTGKEIHAISIKHLGIDTLYPNNRYWANEQIYLNSNKTIIAATIVIGRKDPKDSILLIVIYNIKTEERLLVIEGASHQKIEGAMKQTVNSWIMDLDNDGDLDIAIMKDLVDYELPNEYSDNISGVEGFGYYLKDDKMEFDYLSQENYSTFQIKK